MMDLPGQFQAFVLEVHVVKVLLEFGMFLLNPLQFLA
jgi:hypothetical protein